MIPYRAPFSTTLDASGNATVTLTPRSAFWSVLTATAIAATASALWAYGPLGTSGLLFTSGQQVTMGPMSIGPNEQIQITISGGAPGDTVRGTLWGQQANDASEASTLAASASAATTPYQPPRPQRLLYTRKFAANDSMTLRNIAQIPSGAQIIAVLCQIDNTSTMATPFINVIGHQSLISICGFSAGLTGAQTRRDEGSVISAIDTTLDLSVVADSASSGTIWIVAIFDVVGTTILGAASSGIVPVSGTGAPTAGALLVDEPGGIAIAFAVSVNPNTTTVINAANLLSRVRRMIFQIDAGAASAIIYQINFTAAGTSPLTYGIARWTAGTNSGLLEYDFGNLTMPNPAGMSISSLSSSTGGALFYGTLIGS